MNTDEHLSAIIANLNQRTTRLEQTGIPGLRDFLATAALSMLASKDWQTTNAEVVARRAYAIAEAMLKHREIYNATNTDNRNTGDAVS